MTSYFNSDLQAELDCLVSSVECCDVKRRELDVMMHSYAMFNQFLPTCQLQVSSIRSNSVDVKPTGKPIVKQGINVKHKLRDVCSKLFKGF